MADYENTVGIQLNSDFTKAIANARILASALRNMKNDVSALSSSVKQLKKSFDLLNNFKFTALTTQLNGLQELARMIRTLDVSGITGKANELKAALEALKGIDVSAITKLREIPKAMKSIASLDSSKVGKVFSTLATQIQPFIAKLKEASDEIKALANVTDAIKKFHKEMEKAKIKTEELGQKANKTGSKLKSMFTVGNMIYWYNMSKRFFDFINTSIKKSIDFRETENLFATAMGNMRNEALKLTNALGEVFGMAIPDMMQAQGTFKNMLSSIKGLAEESSTMLSGVLTKMSIDFASLYNVSIDSAITKMQAALSRQVRPIRSTSGYDITQNVLGASLQQLGIYDRTVSQLGEMEKRLLIIYTLQQQMGNSGALGDFAKTIEQPAQQLKILEQQIKEVGRWLGAVFEGTIGRILPYINAFTMVIKELLKAFAMLVGYKMPTSSRGENILDMMDNTAESFGDTLGDGIDKATEKVKNLLAPFDKVNVLTEPQSSSGGSVGGSGGLGDFDIDSRILDAIKDYENGLDKVKMKANEIRDAIMEWLGFTKIIDELTGEITWKYEKGAGAIEKIRQLLSNLKLGDSFNAWDVTKGLNKALQGVIDFISGTFSGNWRDVWDGICEYVEGVFYALPDNSVGRFVRDTVGLFRVWWNNHVKPLFAPYEWEAITSIVGESIANAWLDFVDFWAKGGVQKWFNESVKPWFTKKKWEELAENIKLAIKTKWDEIVTWWNNSALVKWWKEDVVPWFDKELWLTLIDIIRLSIKTKWDEMVYTWKNGISKWWKEDVAPWFTREKWSALGNNIKSAIQSKWNEFSSWWGNTAIVQWWNKQVKPWFTKEKWITATSGLKDGLVQTFKNAINSGTSLFNRFIDSLNSKLTLSWGDFELFGQKIIERGSFTLFRIPKIPSFWNGGIVPRNIGQLFIANEPGNPELVGNIGGHTSVVNNNMIIEAIKGAMKSAIIEGMQLVFQEMPNGDMYVDIYIDGVFTERKLIDENEKHLLKTGKPVFFGK